MTGYTLDQLKARQAGAHWTDEQVASKVRMLMRDDLDHEMVCVMARDRIRYLSAALGALEKTIAGLTDCVKQTGEVCAETMNAKLDLEAAVGARDKEIERLCTDGETGRRAVEILKWILDTCNQHPESDAPIVAFAPDWGGNSLTVFVNGSHSHVGFYDIDFRALVDQLHALLTKGTGLSFVGPIDQCAAAKAAPGQGGA